MNRANETIRGVFARNVKYYREVLKYSQEKLAEKAGLSVQTIKDIEGYRRWVSDKTVSLLAKSLNLQEFQLFLPEKYEKDKKPAIKTLSVLKEKVKNYVDDQFEKALKTGDFSL